MPNKHDFCRNEQHPCPLPLWSGSDNLGAVESRLSREKNKSAHNLCILNAGRIYLWGLQATIYILAYVKDRKHKLVSGVADTAGSRRQQREQELGLRARMKKLIIHLLFRTANGCRLLARGSAIIWLTAHVTPRNLFKTALFFFFCQ